MGRYYSGDIEGKFWFGVQASDDADFFGGQQAEPSSIQYAFSEDDLPNIRQGIADCLVALGDNKEKLDFFFGEGGGYTQEKLSQHLGLPFNSGDPESRDNPVTNLLEWYARLELGEKILRCVEKKGSCDFEAEV